MLFNDYFPLIENICIEEDEDYKINILKFLFQEISQNEKIVKDDIPKNIYDIVVNASKNIDNENLKEIAENIVEILNQRQKKKTKKIKKRKKIMIMIKKKKDLKYLMPLWVNKIAN